MKTSDFYYDLPKELIAQTPIEKRDASRLMTLERSTGAVEHHHFYELPDFLNPGDCLILNDSRVLPARLLGQRLPGGGACEVLLLIDRGDKTWECLVRPGRKMRTGAKLSFGNGELTAEVVGELEGGNRLVRFDYDGIFLEVLEHLGKMPLPPYIKESPWQRCGPHGRTALYARAAGDHPGQGREDRVCDAARGPWHLPSREGGHHRGPRDAQRVLHHPSGDGGSH